MKFLPHFASIAGVCIFLLLTSVLCGQTPYLQWSVTYGGNEDDYPCEIEVLEDGFLIGAYTKSYGNQNDKFDFYLIRTDEMGNIVWERTYGGSQNEQMASLKQAQDGGYIMSGVTQSWGQGGSDGYIVRVDKNGDTLWTKYYGGLTWDQFYCGIPTIDQGFAFTGFSSVYLKGDQAYIVKTDQNGDSLWTQTEGGDNQDYGYYVLEDESGGYASLGHTWSQGNESMGYLVRLNSSGHVTWWSAFGDTGEDYCRWFDQNDDHSFTIVGNTQSYGNGMDDFWLVFTNPDGTPVGWYTYGGSEADICYNGSRDMDGGILMAGHTWSFGVQGPNMFFMKTTAEGDSLWALNWGDQDWEYAWDIKPTFDGGYVVLGRDYSISTGDNNIVLLKYGPHPTIYNTIEQREDLNLPIADEQTTTDLMTITAFPNSTVSGVTIYLDTIFHGEIKDLVITLTHDSYQATLLESPPAGGANIFGTVLHPAASCDVQAAIAPMSGIYRPHYTTAIFNGTNVNGEWELNIYDTQPGNTGILEDWSLQIYYESPVGIEEPLTGTITDGLLIFPNPFTDKVTVQVSMDGVYRLLDISGRVFGSGVLNSGVNTIEGIKLSKGIYFLEVESGTTKIIRKLIKN